MISAVDKERLDAMLAAQSAYDEIMFPNWAKLEDKQGALRFALLNVRMRRFALRLLFELTDEEKEMQFSNLMDLATVGHCDIGQVRAIIRSLPREWLLANLGPHVELLLARDDAETYRRLAELLCDIGDQASLTKLIDRARMSSDPNILEIAQDFEELAG